MQPKKLVALNAAEYADASEHRNGQCWFRQYCRLDVNKEPTKQELLIQCGWMKYFVKGSLMTLPFLLMELLKNQTSFYSGGYRKMY
jgi:hypothetical protein